jgi:hypothetical protein
MGRGEVFINTKKQTTRKEKNSTRIINVTLFITKFTFPKFSFSSLFLHGPMFWNVAPAKLKIKCQKGSLGW